MNAIVAYQLSKRYGSEKALSDISLVIPEGGMYALVGAENCGKTTAIRLFSGLSLPSAGECSLLGMSPGYDYQKVRRMTGVVLDTAKLYQNNTVSENLTFFAKLYEIDKNDTIDRISFLLHKLDIWDYRDIEVSKVPTNVLQRANLARALIHSPRVLLMDEPTEGLDKDTREIIRSMLVHVVREEGGTALLCTRHMDHAQEICTQYGIMDKGQLVTDGDLEQLRKYSGLKFKVSFRLAETSPEPKGFVASENLWIKSIRDEHEIPEIIATAVYNGCQICEVKTMKPTLSDIYSRIFYGDAETRYFDGEDYEDEIEQAEQADEDIGGWGYDAEEGDGLDNQTNEEDLSGEEGAGNGEV